MTIESQLLLLTLGAYLLGSVPFGLLVGLAKGIDVRTAGSGNIGATNVGRLLGGKFFALVFTLDLLKSLLPMLLATWLLHRSASAPYSSVLYLLWMLVGFAAVLGHMFSAFLKFKGGKGVATSAGLMLGLWPYYTIPALLTVGVFAVVFLIWRYVSLGSIVGACAFPILYAAIGYWRNPGEMRAQWPLLAFAILVALLITWKHRGNIARLRAGTENPFRRQQREPQ